jgi:hypothetical protein
MIVILIGAVFLLLRVCRTPNKSITSVTSTPPRLVVGTPTLYSKKSLDIPKDVVSKWEEWKRKREADPDFEWKMPIVFFGRVIDENDEPVADADVHCEWTDLSPKGTSKADIKSQSDGTFTISGIRGKFMLIDVEKAGYYTSSANRRGFEYAAYFSKNYHEPNPKNPVVFRLRKKGQGEPLITRQTLYGIRPDGTPHYIDLVTGKKKVDEGPTGDLMIAIMREPMNEKKRFAWSATLEGVNGAALIESDEEFMFTAPENGYVPSLSYAVAADDPAWDYELTKKYYVQARNGKIYARIVTTIMSQYRDAAAVDLQVQVNPSGSRNLESK